jgi:hypothetical protein
MSEPIFDAKLMEVEAAFRGLLPAAPALPRDRLLYEAGRRSVRRGVWPVATGAFALLSVVLGVRSFVSGPSDHREVVTQAPVESRSTASAVPDQSPARASSSNAAVVDLLLLGAPDYLPAHPARVREFEQWLQEGSPGSTAGNVVLPAVSPDRGLGLPPGTLGNPPRSRSDFGPIRRGEA